MNTYRAVQDLILERIERKEYGPGMQIDSFRTLARAADTTIVTVLRALTNLVAQGHLRHEAGRGYFVETASGPATPAKTVGILVNFTGKEIAGNVPVLRQIVPTISAAMINQGRPFLILNGVDNKESSFVMPENIAAHRMDGLFVFSIYDYRYLADLSRAQPGVVALDVDASDCGVDCIAFDNAGSALKMVLRLATLGARRIAYVGGPLAPKSDWRSRRFFDPAARLRHDGWRLGLQAAGLPYDPALCAPVSWRDGEHASEAVRGLLAGGARPDAILAENPAAVLQTLAKAGVPPGSIRVAGWSQNEGEGLIPGLDMVARCDMEELFAAGIELLAQRLAHPDCGVQRRVLEPRIVEPAR